MYQDAAKAGVVGGIILIIVYVVSLVFGLAPLWVALLRPPTPRRSRR